MWIVNFRKKRSVEKAQYLRGLNTMTLICEACAQPLCYNRFEVLKKIFIFKRFVFSNLFLEIWVSIVSKFFDETCKTFSALCVTFFKPKKTFILFRGIAKTGMFRKHDFGEARESSDRPILPIEIKFTNSKKNKSWRKFTLS